MHGRTGRPAGSGRPEPVSRCMLIAGRAGTVCAFPGVACGVRDDRRGLRRSCWPAGSVSGPGQRKKCGASFVSSAHSAGHDNKTNCMV
jgi:hypothetical protein